MIAAIQEFKHFTPPRIFRANSSHTGFTLIELSVVLVIIGLVVGSVLVGRDLIESSQIRAQASQLARYSTAVNTFRSKYNSLPGDMLTADVMRFGLPYFMGGAGNHPNGDGLFNYAAAPQEFTGLNSEEFFLFWPQLGYFGLVEGSYSCSGATGCPGMANYVYTGIALTYPSTVGVYFPAMKINEQFGILPATINNFGGNWWVLGIKSYDYALQEATALAPSLTPLKALKLDQKMDDGIPMSGAVRVPKIPGNPDSNGNYYTGFDIASDDNTAPPTPPANCVTSGGTAYAISNTATACIIFVKMQ